MKAPLRHKYFLLLAAVLGVFILIQLTAWLLWELWEYVVGIDESVGEGIGEVLVLVVINIICLPFLLIFLWYLSHRMLRPLQSISETATRICDGKLNERIDVEEQEDELSELAATINEAFERYQEANAKLQRFGADASHQLRTPLTSMRTAGEISLTRDRSASEYRATIESMLEDAGHLTGVVERLLMLARLESRELQKQFVDVSLQTIAETIAEQYRPLGSDKDVTLRTEGSDIVRVRGDSSLLEQVAANLLDNAIRFSPRGETVTLRTGITSNRDAAFLQVEDHGPGVASQLEPRLFDRFTRSPTSSESRSGLGLAVVSEIVRAHGGLATYERTKDGRSCFQICVPVP